MGALRGMQACKSVFNAEMLQYPEKKKFSNEAQMPNLVALFVRAIAHPPVSTNASTACRLPAPAEQHGESAARSFYIAASLCSQNYRAYCGDRCERYPCELGLLRLEQRSEVPSLRRSRLLEYTHKCLCPRRLHVLVERIVL